MRPRPRLAIAAIAATATLLLACTSEGAGAPPIVALATTSPAVTSTTSPAGFIWPVVGPITSVFSVSHPLGIDIGVDHVPVVASAAGNVVFTGGDAAVSYGLYIELDHGNGYSTLYAQLSEIRVAIGQWVDQDETIAVSGDTGRSTGPHLHFEIRRGEMIQDPLLFLP